MKSSEIFPESLVAFKIMPLEDMNEFTTHILEVVNAHMMLSKSNSQPSAGRAPVSNPGMGEAGNFGGNNFIPANGLTVAQNQVNTGVAPDFARHRAVNCYFLNGAKYLTHFFLIKRFLLDRGADS